MSDLSIIEVCGNVRKREGNEWVDGEKEAFTKAFFKWLTDRGLSFGGYLEPPSPKGFSCPRAKCDVPGWKNE